MLDFGPGFTCMPPGKSNKYLTQNVAATLRPPPVEMLFNVIHWHQK